MNGNRNTLKFRLDRNLADLAEEVVLVAHDLTPSDTATMDKKKVLGFLTDIGGRTSHTAIMSRTLEIAAVVGLNSATTEIKDGDFIAFNGNTGEVIIDPNTRMSVLKQDHYKYDEFGCKCSIIVGLYYNTDNSCLIFDTISSE